MARIDIQRDLYTVIRHADGWAVEHAGEIFGVSRDKEEAKAAAHRRARVAFDAGQGCQVRVTGEHGFAGV